MSETDAATRRTGLGLPVVALIGLALLAVPRAVLHDLGVVSEGSALNQVLVFVPLIVWVVVAVAARVPNPLLTLLLVGAIYGVFLTLTHQLLWDVAFGDDPPRLGGNLAGLDPATQSLLVRGFAAVSSLFTGALTGAVTGLVAWAIVVVRRRRDR
jgi:hypothetical protein